MYIKAKDLKSGMVMWQRYIGHEHVVSVSITETGNIEVYLSGVWGSLLFHPETIITIEDEKHEK